MKRFRVARQAQEDLEDLWMRIARGSIRNADRFVAKLVGKFPTLAALPDLGSSYEELAPGLRGMVVGNYVVFYRRIAEGVEIVRVLHGARDLPEAIEP
jgi:toxin ParE1/3/4